MDKEDTLKAAATNSLRYAVNVAVLTKFILGHDLDDLVDGVPAKYAFKALCDVIGVSPDALISRVQGVKDEIKKTQE